MSALPAALSDALKAEFRKGFYRDRPAHWLEKIGSQTAAAAPDVGGHLAAIRNGRTDFAYPGHDAAVLRLLQALVAEQSLRRGADVGCATGAFPAMQLASGIERCTVFEVRPTPELHPQVEVRIQDLTRDADLAPEFDLVTCLSTIEHVGLGRYGDPLDPWGDVALARGLRRIVRPGGFVVLSFPVGAGCVVFNQHRIYSPLRREALFEGFELLRSASDLTPRRRLGYEAVRWLRGRVGLFHQPIYLLRPRPTGSDSGRPRASD